MATYALHLHIMNRQHTHIHTYLIPLQLKGLKLHGDAVLSGSDHLPNTVLVGRILFRPTGSADGPVQLGEETAACRWKHTHNSETHTCQGHDIYVYMSYKPQGQNCTENDGVLELFYFTLWWEWDSPHPAKPHHTFTTDGGSGQCFSQLFLFRFQMHCSLKS